MDITLLTRLVTYLIFGCLGYLLGKKLQVPNKISTWILWLILLVLSESLFVSTRLVDIFGFVIYLNWVIQALVAGILIDYVVRASRTQKPQVNPSGTTKP